MLESMDRFILETSNNGDGKTGGTRRGEEQRAHSGTAGRYASAAAYNHV
jgi:hypothetical protein